MPAQGEQHKPPLTPINPFEEAKPHISEYTAKEIAKLSSRLEKQLGPEYISSRPGAGGGKVHYLSADKCINLANEVFGFNGWSSAIQNVQIDFVDENQSTGKVSLGLSVIVRVTLRDGTYHEDIGYGHIENCKGKAPAFEKAKKEGTTDGLKRALRNFGNLLGNCVYDKDYIAKVTKLKIAPTKWDPENLHRHPDFAPVKTEPPSEYSGGQPSLPQSKGEWLLEADEAANTAMPGDGEDEFGSDDFDEADFSVPHGDHPDEVCLAPVNASDRLRRRSSLPHKPHQPPVRDAKQNCLQRPRLPPLDDNSTGSRAAPQTPINSSRSNLGPVIYANGQFANQDPLPRPPDSAMPNQQANSSGQAQQDSFPQFPQYAQQSSGGPQHDNQCNDSSNLINHDAPVGFFTARAAESLQGGSGLPIKAPSFNPHLESPSIRKTPGVDHTKTKPVGRDVVGNSASAQPPSTNVPRANFVNPQTDKTRRLGMPGGSPSPLQNRGSYKPPSMKRPAESNLVRSALGDVTAASVNEAVADAGDEKRPRISMEAQGTGNGGALNV